MVPHLSGSNIGGRMLAQIKLKSNHSDSVWSHLLTAGQKVDTQGASGSKSYLYIYGVAVTDNNPIPNT